MESALCKRITDSGLLPNRSLILLRKPPVSEDQSYYQHLKEIHSYRDGSWKRRPEFRIRETFVVSDFSHPENGIIDKIAIRKKAGNIIELEDSAKFDLTTGCSLYGEPKYIFPVEDLRVWAAWEPQSLRRRIEGVLPGLRFADLRSYAGLLAPGRSFGVFEVMFGRGFDYAAAMLSEREAARMAVYRKGAKKAILDHLPLAIEELRALVTMVEGDAK